MAEEAWSEWIGLRRVAATLLVRGIIAAAIWAVLTWITTPALEWLAGTVGPHWSWLAIVGLVCAIPGVSMGHALGRGLTERAGFVSIVITMPAAGVGAGVILGGAHLAWMFQPAHGWVAHYIQYATAVFAALWIIKMTLTDE